MAFTFVAQVAWDPNGKQAVKNASFQVYAVSDTAFATPLPITDPFGVALPGNILNSGTQGVFPQFQQATNPAVVVADSTKTYVWTFNCVPTDAATAAFANDKTSSTSAAIRTLSSGVWQSNTAYVVNQPVINPTGDLVRCTTAHTSTTTYDSTKFTLNATDANGSTAAALSATYGLASDTWGGTQVLTDTDGMPYFNPPTFGRDTDGTPYFNANGVPTASAIRIRVDTDSVPYFA